MDALQSLSRPSGTMGEVEVLLETLEKEGSRRRNSTRWIQFTVAAMLVVVIVGLMLDHSSKNSLGIGSLFILASLLEGSCVYGLTPGLHRAVTHAAKLSDKRLLGAMIEALDSGDPKLKVMLESASAELLEKVTPEDLGLLDEYQLDRLVGAIRLSADARFCKAAIQAVGFIGTNRTLQALEVVLNDPTILRHRRTSLEPPVRAAMAEMRIRLAKERLSRGGK